METEHAAPLRSRFARARLVALVLGLLLLAGLLAAWFARRPIAAHYVDRYLAERGVPARYRIADLGLSRQRLVDVVIGDPRAPDLVADWVEVRTRVTLAGVSIPDIRAGHVRLRGRLVGGRLSLGALDRLIPATTAPGGPFALPAIHVDVADARMRLQTPVGLIGLKADGQGRLDDGFAGRIAAVSDRLSAGDCRFERLAVTGRLRIVGGVPRFAGPLLARRAACARLEASGLATTVQLSADALLQRFDATADLSVAAVKAPQARVQALAGRVSARGGPRAVSATVSLRSGAFAGLGLKGSAASLTGPLAWDRAGGIGFGAGQPMHVAVRDIAAPPAVLRRAADVLAGARGSPVAPLAERLTAAMIAAGGRFSAEAEFAGDPQRLAVSSAALTSASGARLHASGPFAVSQAGVRLDGEVNLAGGGLPHAELTLRQRRIGGPVEGTVTIAPYEVFDARLALSPVRFTATPHGDTRVRTTVTLTGPLPGGRVEALRIPVDALWNGAGRLVANTDCTPLAIDRLAVSGLRLAATRARLCPIEGALFRLNGGRIGGGARIGAVGLSGTLGSSPVRVEARSGVLRLADRGFAIEGLATRLGAPERETRLSFARLTGSLATLSGAYAGGGGQIGNVPLVLSEAQGRWAVEAGRLSTQADLTVSDAAAQSRFVPMRARGVTLTLAGNRIDTAGVLGTAAGVPVANVAIHHDLGSGQGRADLDAPGIAFTPKGLQPTDLTPLTLGVIADVDGIVRGAGHIRWSGDRVTSDGAFTTPGMDLAAAFGPARGISGTLRFTDLIALESAPGQMVTIASVNPGIAVTDGTLRFQTLPGARVRIEDGRWPFAGGALVLAPTLLDFGQPAERRMTFTATGVNARQFLQQFDFKNLDATGTFDGTLPMIFDARGGRIENGHLVVRQGGGTIAYLGELTEKDLGTWGNLAFQALRSLRYRSLDITMNGPLDGEMITAVRFAGISQGEGAKSNFLIRRLQRLPFVFNVRIAAPFRQLLDSAQGFYDPRRLVERNLPALMQRQEREGLPVQPQESRTVP